MKRERAGERGGDGDGHVRCKCVGDRGWRVSCMVHCQGMPISWCVRGEQCDSASEDVDVDDDGMEGYRDVRGRCSGVSGRGDRRTRLYAGRGRGGILLYRGADEGVAEGLRAEFSGCRLWEADATSESRFHCHLRGLTPLHCSRELEVVGGDSGAGTCAWDWSL